MSCPADSVIAISDTFPYLYRWCTSSMISFLAGKPNPSTFPFESITMKIKPGVQGHDESAASTSQPHEITISGDRLAEALQYGATAGLPGLVKVDWRPYTADCLVKLTILPSSGSKLSKQRYITGIKKPRTGV